MLGGRVDLRVILFPEVSSAGAVDLSVKIGALRLRNPILAASGTFGYGLEFAHIVDLNRLGGFVDRKSTRLNSSHSQISYAVFCLKKKKKTQATVQSHYPS